VEDDNTLWALHVLLCTGETTVEINVCEVAGSDRVPHGRPRAQFVWPAGRTRCLGLPLQIAQVTCPDVVQRSSSFISPCVRVHHPTICEMTFTLIEPVLVQ
jgi:hypothetical protein